MVGVYSPTLSPWLAWTSYGLAPLLTAITQGGSGMEGERGETGRGVGERQGLGGGREAGGGGRGRVWGGGREAGGGGVDR